MTRIELIEKKENHLAFFELSSEEVQARVTNLGCHILSLRTKDRNGHWDDIVLGYENVEDCFLENSCMGAIVGRVANRIGNASFTLNEREYKVAANCGQHHLHGGMEGFDRKLFDYEVISDGIQFHYLSKDKEEGYPGNLDLFVTYRLTGNQFSIGYRANSDRDTLLNVTNHTYFNLSGTGAGDKSFKEKIYHHFLKIEADQIACVDDTGLAYGEYLPVADSPFDFREFHEIGERMDQDHPQLINAGGYDHSWILNNDLFWNDGSAGRISPKERKPQIELKHPGTGRRVSVFTTFPVVQVYTANFLAGGCNGRHGIPYENRDGVALEAQYISNSIQIEKEPTVILRAGEQWENETVWSFDTV